MTPANKIGRTNGFSLVELMVAMTIGLFILVAISTVLVNSKKNYTTQDSLARLQENGRFAIQFLTHDIRMAGYFGCNHSMDNITSHLNGGGFSFQFNIPIEGFEAGGNAWLPSNTTPLGLTPAPWANTDAIAIRLLDTNNPISLTSDMPQTSADMKVTNGSGLQTGDVVMITDCNSADLFQITNCCGSNIGFDNVVHNSGAGTPGNATKDMSKKYATGAKILKFNTLVYYIGASIADATRPALYRQLLVTSGGGSSPQSQELIEGIENLQILYGKDTTNSDRVADIFLKANDGALAATADWNNVVAVRIGLLASTLANSSVAQGNDKQFGTDVDTKTYPVNGYTVAAANDRRQRRVFTTTIIPRNLQ